MKSRPETGEYAEFYAKYIALVPENDVVSALDTQRVQMLQLLAGRSERDGGFRYGPDKWVVKEVIGHVTDAERIFAYRALRIARGDQKPLAGFDENDYVRNGGFQRRTLEDLAQEFSMVRTANVLMFCSLSDEAWLRRGVANGYEVTARALAHIIAGHELHHRKILEERYFQAIPRA